jgi:hypothetical protein
MIRDFRVRHARRSTIRDFPVRHSTNRDLRARR